MRDHMHEIQDPQVCLRQGLLVPCFHHNIGETAVEHEAFQELKPQPYSVWKHL